MRKSFLDNPNIVYIFGAYLIAMPLAAALLTACTKPSPEEKAKYDAGYSADVKADLLVVSPRPGVECYILRAHSSADPRVMSCVGTIPTTTGQ